MENKIIFVAASDSMKENAEKVIRQMGFSIPIIISKPGNVLQDVNRYPESEAFISRWSNAQVLRSAEKNVIEVRVEFQDLMEPLQNLSKLGVKKVAVLTQRGLIADCEKNYQISDLMVLVRCYDFLKDVDRIVQNLISEKAEAFIGSQAVIDSAEKFHIPARFLNCGADSIRHAVEEAVAQVEKFSVERIRQKETLNKIQNFSTELYHSIDKAFGAAKKLDESSQELAVVSKGAADIAGKAYEQMKETENILKLITKITMETKILGINGAVESARAGDQGRGFSIIAEEIRQLAIKSNQSAKTIGTDMDKLKNYVEEVLNHAEICKSISESQAVDNSQVTKMLEELSNTGKKLIEYMNAGKMSVQ